MSHLSRGNWLEGSEGVKARLENGVVDNVRGRRAAKSPPPPWAPPVEMRTGHFVTLTTITLITWFFWFSRFHWTRVWSLSYFALDLDWCDSGWLRCQIKTCWDSHVVPQPLKYFSSWQDCAFVNFLVKLLWGNGKKLHNGKNVFSRMCNGLQ